MTFRYDFAPTPFGDALAVFSDEGIVRFDLSESEDPSVPWLLENVARELRAVPEPDPGAADELADLLDRYFDGAPIRFDEHLSLDWRLVDGFPRRALEAIRTIEWGETLSYGRSPSSPATRARPAPWDRPAASPRSRSSCPCTASSAPTALPVTTGRTPSASGSSSTSNRAGGASSATGSARVLPSRPSGSAPEGRRW